MKTLKKVLMEQEGFTSAQAEAEIEEARELLSDYLAEGDIYSAENICEELWGLEPDYIDELY